MDDANFEHTTANGAILRLTKELSWIGKAGVGQPCVYFDDCCVKKVPLEPKSSDCPSCGWPRHAALCCHARLVAHAEETLAAADSLRDEPPTSFIDRVFDNEMNIAVGSGIALWVGGVSCVVFIEAASIQMASTKRSRMQMAS